MHISIRRDNWLEILLFQWRHTSSEECIKTDCKRKLTRWEWRRGSWKFNLADCLFIDLQCISVLKIYLLCYSRWDKLSILSAIIYFIVLSKYNLFFSQSFDFPCSSWLLSYSCSIKTHGWLHVNILVGTNLKMYAERQHAINSRPTDLCKNDNCC